MTIMNMLIERPAACPACDSNWGSNQRATFRYCEGQCIATTDAKFENIAAMGDAPIPHLHLTCARCDFVCLMKPSHPDEIQRIRFSEKRADAELGDAVKSVAAAFDALGSVVEDARKATS